MLQSAHPSDCGRFLRNMFSPAGAGAQKLLETVGLSARTVASKRVILARLFAKQGRMEVVADEFEKVRAY